MTWFEDLTAIPEQETDQLRRDLRMEGDSLVSQANGSRWHVGSLETPSLQELRERTANIGILHDNKLSVSEVIADAQSLHADPDNSGALFQVASQFNLLEMAGPHVTPEDGVGIYQHDRTQGPACAVAAGAGTIYRNYFVPVDGQIGQTEERQIDCIAELGRALSKDRAPPWVMQNGYLIADETALGTISEVIGGSSEAERDRLRGLLRIGIQKHTEVTLAGCGHRVTQAYCSALPISYNHQPVELWEPFARLVLEATYEATLRAALINRHETGNATVYLTFVGGGVFGNRAHWILDSLQRALDLHRTVGLDVRIVSYGGSKDTVQSIVRDYH